MGILTGLPSDSGPPIVFESVLFVMTMVKFYTALREGWGQEPVISRFMKDGIWAFALPFGVPHTPFYTLSI
jgi:hypothetical protein